jgi:hypothetical protein
MFLADYNRMSIYGVTDKTAQESVLKGLTDYYHSAHTNPLHVMFFERENWNIRHGKNGATFGSRGPEQMIRVVNIG